jgi:hypothetical protein
MLGLPISRSRISLLFLRQSMIGGSALLNPSSACLFCSSHQIGTLSIVSRSRGLDHGALGNVRCNNSPNWMRKLIALTFDLRANAKPPRVAR